MNIMDAVMINAPNQETLKLWQKMIEDTYRDGWTAAYARQGIHVEEAVAALVEYKKEIVNTIMSTCPELLCWAFAPDLEKP